MRSTASKEGAMTESVKVSIEYHGKKYQSTVRCTIAHLMVNPDGLVKEAKLAASYLMSEALRKARR